MEQTAQLLKVSDVARRLGISRSHAYCLVRERALPAFRLNGGSIRIPAAAFEKWLTEREDEAMRSVRKPAP